MIKKLCCICLVLLVATQMTACASLAPATPTAVPPTATSTVVPPTATPTAVPPTSTPTAIPPTLTPTATPEFIIVTDKTGALQVSVPSSWTKVNGSSFSIAGKYSAAAIEVAPDLDKFNYYSGEGAWLMASSTIAQAGGYIQILDFFRTNIGKSCKFVSRNDYTDPNYQGKFDIFSTCNNLQKQVLFMMAVRPKDDPTGYIVMLMINFINPDQKTLTKQIETILSSFKVVGALPK